jgi:hypothetical protein
MWKEYYAYDIAFTDLAAGAGATFTPGEIRIDTDADFEFVKTMYQPAAGRYRVRYRDDTNGRYLMKGSADLRAIGGTALYSMAPVGPTPPGFVPFIWPKPYIINAATTFTVEIADYSGIISSPRLTFHGSKIRTGECPWMKKYRAEVPYTYPIATNAGVSVGASSTTTAAIATDNDAHFLCYKIVGSRTGACTVAIKDGARDRQWMNQAVTFDNLVGNGHFPHILATPRFIARGSVIAVVISDLSGAANVVDLEFVGVKLYE